MQEKENANKLRRLETPEEKILWKRLKGRRLGNYKFRRQVTIDSLIVDFCCFEKRLVIELDGFHHRQNKQTDYIRDKYLADQGFTVIRIWNSEIRDNLEKFLDRVISALETPSSGLPAHNNDLIRAGQPPSPVKGEGYKEGIFHP